MTSESVALVSGGASGIGAAVVACLLEAGRRVVVLDVKEPCDYRCDVSDPAAVDDTMAALVASVGVPARVVCSAGIARAGMLVDHSFDESRACSMSISLAPGSSSARPRGR